MKMVKQNSDEVIKLKPVKDTLCPFLSFRNTLPTFKIETTIFSSQRHGSSINSLIIIRLKHLVFTIVSLNLATEYT